MDLRNIDTDNIVDRYETTFARDNHDRPLFNISYGLGKDIEQAPPPSDLIDRWFNFEWRVETFERNLENTGFLREGFPHFNCNLGPDILAACTGSELVFESDSTSWAKFRIDDWTNEPPIEFKEDGHYWQKMKQFVTMSAQRGQGKWLTQSGDLHTNGDALSALRGPENLLMDLYDCPDEIHKRLQECHQVFKAMLQGHLDIIQPLSNGLNSCWCSAVCRGSYTTIQNDFCCMVGPDMFDEFFKDYIEEEASCVDRCVYHLDGPGAIRHLESICASKSLDTIQWVPGAGNKPVNEWPELYQSIQNLGKGCWIHGAPAEQLKLLAVLKPEGCMYNLGFASRGEAQDWLGEAERMLSNRKA